jgi:hypothetical protein
VPRPRDTQTSRSANAEIRPSVAPPIRRDGRARQRRTTRALLAAALAVAALAGAANTYAAAPIVAVWSFNGGSVGVSELPNGTFVGTVITPTQFALCPHPIGEQMWTGIRANVDGSYSGFHQWFFESASCLPNPTLGRTAWRVLESPDRGQILRVCFSEPGDGQPSIGSNGEVTGDSYGCVDSAPIASLPEQAAPGSRAAVLGFNRAVVLPNGRKCLSRRAFRIHLHDPKNDPLKQVEVRLAGHTIAITRNHGKLAAYIDLRGFPKGAFTVRVHAVTVLGHRLSGSRTYRTCVKASQAPRKHSPTSRA